MSVQATKPDKSRLFFALWPERPVLEALKSTQQQLDLPEGKPVPAEKLHITLLFLGEVGEDHIDAFKSFAGQLHLEPCELVLDRLEHWVRPAVLCLTAQTTPEALLSLIEALKRGAKKMGFKPEKRPFRAHLTLARKVRKRVVSREIDPIHWPVKDFVLVKSVLASTGAHYEILERWQAE